MSAAASAWPCRSTRRCVAAGLRPPVWHTAFPGHLSAVARKTTEHGRVRHHPEWHLPAPLEPVAAQYHCVPRTTQEEQAPEGGKVEIRIKESRVLKILQTKKSDFRRWKRSGGSSLRNAVPQCRSQSCVSLPHLLLPCCMAFLPPAQASLNIAQAVVVQASVPG